jgi:RNA polymerase sigma-70 factor (ECF subfamily)
LGVYPEETEAVHALKRGEVGGLDTLVRLHQSKALRLAFAIIHDRHAAEDCVADAFVRVFERINQYDDRRSFASWFYRIVVNGALNTQRARRQQQSLEAEGVNDTAIDRDDPEHEAVQAELRSVVINAILKLPIKQRAAVTLRYYLELDERTIADILKVPVGTVKWRLFAARKSLRRSLSLDRELTLRMIDDNGDPL